MVAKEIERLKAQIKLLEKNVYSPVIDTIKNGKIKEYAVFQ